MSVKSIQPQMDVISHIPLSFVNPMNSVVQHATRKRNGGNKPSMQRQESL